MMTNHGNRLTQGQFSFLPDLTDAQITAQIAFALGNGWAVNVEYTDDPHPRNTYWEMYGMPMFDLLDPAGILTELNACRRTFPNHYIRVTAFDSTRGWRSSPASGWCGRRSRAARFVTRWKATPRRRPKASATSKGRPR